MSNKPKKSKLKIPPTALMGKSVFIIGFNNKFNARKFKTV